MKNFITVIVFTIMLVAVASGGVYKKQVTKVKFKGIGELTNKETLHLTENRKLTDTESKFDGKGILGFGAKLFFKSGKTGLLLNLDDMTMANINYKKKEYTLKKIEKLKMPDGYQGGYDGSEDVETPNEMPEQESNIKIIRRELRVEDTGNTAEKNKFNCREYIVYYIVEWEDVENGYRGKDSLRTQLWTTSEQGDVFQAAMEEEMAFSKKYLAALGIDIEATAEDILGMKWLKKWGQVNKQQSVAGMPGADDLEKLSQIKGYPVIIDGGYYNILPPEVQEERERARRESQADNNDVDITNPKGMLGRFAKKKMFGRKKKEAEEDGALFRWFTELEELKIKNIKAKDVSVSSKFKKREL